MIWVARPAAATAPFLPVAVVTFSATTSSRSVVSPSFAFRLSIVSQRLDSHCLWRLPALLGEGDGYHLPIEDGVARISQRKVAIFGVMELDKTETSCCFGSVDSR
eukprot:GHVU01218100.1.p2 GENE.GHVU01218100.1~~GHVU01218100.1.p2  ORF type:complete len:105 (+),score=3.88 GHVU01218100.1:1358-1672(+)